jgi:hypothetical protein
VYSLKVCNVEQLQEGTVSHNSEITPQTIHAIPLEWQRRLCWCEWWTHFVRAVSKLQSRLWLQTYGATWSMSFHITGIGVLFNLYHPRADNFESPGTMGLVARF